MPPRTRAGSRENRYRVGYGRLSDNKIMLLRTPITGMLTVYAMNPEENDEENGITMSSEPGISYVMMIHLPGRQKPIWWNFSSMTHDELQATRQFFERLFDLADPITRERDKVAKDAFDQGDDSYGRAYRDLPFLVIREGKIRENSEGVLVRPEGSTSRSGNGLDSDGGVRGDGDELADGQEVDDHSQDPE